MNEWKEEVSDTKELDIPYPQEGSLSEDELQEVFVEIRMP